MLRPRLGSEVVIRQPSREDVSPWSAAMRSGISVMLKLQRLGALISFKRFDLVYADEILQIYRLTGSLRGARVFVWRSDISQSASEANTGAPTQTDGRACPFCPN